MKFVRWSAIAVLAMGLAQQAQAAAWSLGCDGGPMKLDGLFNESAWSLQAFQPISPTGYCSYVAACGTMDTGASALVNAAWNSYGLWIAMNVSDPGTLYANAALPWNGSGVEFFLDLNSAQGGYSAPNYNDANTYQWCIAYDSSSIVEFHNSTPVTIYAASTVSVGTGYKMEVVVPWASVGLSGPPAGGVSGFNVAVDVANTAGNARDHQLAASNPQVNPFDLTPADWVQASYGACVPTPSWTPTTVPPVCAAWAVDGNAVAAGGGVTLTAAANNLRGSAWNVSKIDLSQDFNLSFRAYFGAAAGADGMDFVLQNDARGTAALSASGGGSKGYSGASPITPSVAFDLETFGTNGRVQPEENGVAAALCGNSDWPCPYVFSSSICDNTEHGYQVVWSASAKTLTLIVDGVVRVIYNRDLVASVFGGVSTVYYGFTGATGGSSNLQYVYPQQCTAPTSTATPTFTASPTPTRTPTFTASPSPTITQTYTVSPTPSFTITNTYTVSPTQTFTITNTYSVSPTPTSTITNTHTVSPTPTFTITNTHTVSPTPTFTITNTYTVSPTPTFTITNTYSVSPTPTFTITNTYSVSPTPTFTITNTYTVSPTPTFTITNTYSVSPTPTFTITNTYTLSPTPTFTVSRTYTDSPSPTFTITDTHTASPTPTLTVSRTHTGSPTPSFTITSTLTATPTRSPTRTRTYTASPTPSFTASATFTASGTPTPSRTPSHSPTARPTSSPRPTASPSPTPRPTATSLPTATPLPTASASPLPGSAIVTLKVYDSANLLVRQLPAGSSAALLSAVTLSRSPFDPGQGPLLLSQGLWAFAFDGMDSSGAVLRNGLYILVLESRQGATASTVRVQVQVLGKGGSGVVLQAGPNPSHGRPITLQWLPAVPVELCIYGESGGLVKELGTVSPPYLWHLDSSGGAKVSAGIYLAAARVPGQRTPRWFKLAVLK